MQLTTVQFREYYKNPRNLTEDQFNALRDNIRLLGDLSGIVQDLNSGEIIGGNQRSKTIKQAVTNAEIVKRFNKPTRTGTVALGYILVPDEKGGEPIRMNFRQVRFTPEQCERANITANKMGGQWDWDKLANQFEVKDLQEWGFNGWEIGQYLVKESDAVREDSGAGKLPEQPITVAGDIYTIQTENTQHWIGCQTGVLLDDQPLQLIIADTLHMRKKEGIRGCLNDLSANLIDGGVVYLWFRPSRIAEAVAEIAGEGLTILDSLAWVKDKPELKGGDYLNQHECAIYASKGKRTWYTEGKESSVLSYPQPAGKALKPVTLLAELIANSSKAGDSIGVPFLNYGSCLLAGLQMNRNTYSNEDRPKYIDATIGRFLEFVSEEGIEYVLLRNGKQLTDREYARLLKN